MRGSNGDIFPNSIVKQMSWLFKIKLPDNMLKSNFIQN